MASVTVVPAALSIKDINSKFILSHNILSKAASDYQIKMKLCRQQQATGVEATETLELPDILMPGQGQMLEHVHFVCMLRQCCRNIMCSDSTDG